MEETTATERESKVHVSAVQCEDFSGLQIIIRPKQSNYTLRALRRSVAPFVQAFLDLPKEQDR